MKTIAIGTTSNHKLNAVQAALRRANLQDLLQIVGVKASSGVPEQPYGMTETATGAMNRAFGAIDEVPSADYGLGIENGLFDVGAGEAFIDQAMVILLEKNSSRPYMVSTAVHTTSVGIPCHPKYVRASFVVSRSKTAGEFMAAELGCDATDWHSHVTQGRLSRHDILEQAIFAALLIRFKPRQLLSNSSYLAPGAKIHRVMGLRVVTIDKLEPRDYGATARSLRRQSAPGMIIGHHNSHGLSFDIKHDDGTTASYDPDELELL